MATVRNLASIAFRPEALDVHCLPRHLLLFSFLLQLRIWKQHVFVSYPLSSAMTDHYILINIKNHWLEVSNQYCQVSNKFIQKEEEWVHKKIKIKVNNATVGIVFCCIVVAWIQLDNFSCQQDFFVLWKWN